MKRTPIKAVSQKQALLNARWLGMKDMALYLRGEDAECALCGEPLRYHEGPVDADHIVPRSKGGSYDPDNLQLVGRSCHNSKHRNLPEW